MTKPKKPMTAAERQAASRARRADEGEAVSLSLMVHPRSMDALRRLVRHREQTQSDVVSHALQYYEGSIMADMTPAERKAYRAH